MALIAQVMKGMYQMRITTLLLKKCYPGLLALCLGSALAIMFSPAIAQPESDPYSPERIRSIAWSPDGLRVALGFDDGHLEVVDIFEPNEPLIWRSDMSNPSRIIALAWSPDGRSLAAGSGYPDSALRVWDGFTGEELANYRGFGISVLTASWSPDGRYLVSTTAETENQNIGNAIVVDMETQDVIHLSVSTVSDLAWSPGGDEVAFSHIVNDIVVRSASDWSIVATYSYGDHPVRDNLFPMYINLEWSPDGRFLAAGRGDGQVLVWRVGTAQPFLVLSGSEYVGDDLALGWIYALRFDEQQPYLTSVAGDGLVRTWNVETGTLIAEQRVAPNVDAAFSPLGVRLALASAASAETAGTAAIVPAQTLDLTGRAEVQIVVLPIFSTQIEQLHRRCADRVTRLQTGAPEQVEPVDDRVLSRLCAAELNAVMQADVMQTSGH
jgi:dipeptidyl aminopeptidase/acylaminoacyl peptidase